MDKGSEPIDRRMVPRDRANVGVRPWWKPAPLTCWFLAIMAYDAVILLVASGVRSSGNDAAGNGIGNAFRELFVQAGAVIVGLLALVFVIVRHGGTRIGLLVTLVLVTLLLMTLLQ